ncbi:phage antirepressor KilAC domain-containing protein [Lactiplantibacillus plantarum]|uniref:phage antirepressor KilAC domain-containing protein n=1 Tax=Lactiplantibacillus plantarum TaxID=1590 RepID=UPI0015EBFF5A|nr:phage antirepressor KilAC domain-containing protein [Lactiplantibacillus plantarum]QLQ50934.1 phage antirepressor KilAC domain-containing protein [Lactiplantibacillus plantarum]
MDELIKVTVKNNQQVVSARDLHKGLKATARFSKWAAQNFDDFIEGEDFEGVTRVTPYNVKYPDGKQQEIQDYALTIEMAKELCMMSHTPESKTYRRYLIQIESAWNDPLQVVKRGYGFLMQENEQLKVQNEEMKPKASYADKILANPGLETVKVIAKNYGMAPAKFNQLLHGLGIQYKQGGTWFLYAKYQDKGYVHTEPFDYEDNKGNQQVKNTMKWTQKGQQFLYDFLKAQGIVPTIESLF